MRKKYSECLKYYHKQSQRNHWDLFQIAYPKKLIKINERRSPKWINAASHIAKLAEDRVRNSHSYPADLASYLKMNFTQRL